MGNQLTYIGDVAFSYNEKLKDLVIPQSVTEIGENAFEGAKSLETIRLPKNIKKISKGMFLWCENLKKIEIPSNVNEIGKFAFYDTGISTIEIPSNVTCIPVECFGSSKLNSILFKGKITTVENGAFAYSNIKEIILPESITTIGEEAFKGCRYLYGVTAPRSITSIGKNCFTNSKNVTIKGYRDSVAETYANANNIPFVSLDIQEPMTWITVVDAKTRQPVKDVYCTIGGRKVDISGGYAQIHDSWCQNDWASIRCSAYGYYDYEAPTTILNPGVYNTIELYPVFEKEVSWNSLGINLKECSVSTTEITVDGPIINFLGTEYPIFQLPLSYGYDLFKNVKISNNKKDERFEVLIGDFYHDKIESSKDVYFQTREVVTALNKNQNNAGNLVQNIKKQLKPTSMNLGYQMQTYMCGYMEFDYEGNLLKSGVVFFAELGVKCTYPFAPAPIFYMTFGLSAGLSGKLFLKCNTSGQIGVEGELGFDVTPQAGLGVGVSGIANAEIGLSGKLSNTVRTEKKKIDEALEVKFQGNFYFEYNIFNFVNQKKEWEIKSIDLYPVKNDKKEKSLYAMEEPIQLSLDNWKVRGTEEEQKPVVQKTRIRTGDMYPIDWDYYDADPQLIELDDGRKLAVWTGLDRERSAINQTTLMYSICDEEGYWSTPCQVDDDGTADFSPRLITDGKQVCLIWQNMEVVLADDISLKDAVYWSNLNIAVLDGEKFENIRTLTASGRYEQMQTLTMGEDKIYLTWVENSVGDPTGMMGGNMIWRAVLDYNGNISDVELVCDGLPIITGIDAAYINGGHEIAYSIWNEDLQTTEIYTIRDRQSQKMQTDSDLNYGLQYGRNGLYWISGNKLYKGTRDNGTGKPIESEFNFSAVKDIQVLTNEMGEVILMTCSNGYKSELYKLYYDKNTEMWSHVIRISDLDRGIRNFSGILSEQDGLFILADSFFVLEDEDGGQKYGDNELLAFYERDTMDLVVKGAGYETGDITENNAVKMWAEIENDGTQPVKNVLIQVQDADGTVLYSCEKNYYLPEGDTGILEWKSDLAVRDKDMRYTVSVEPLGREDDRKDNNHYEVEIPCNDLSINEAAIERDGEKRKLKALIENNGTGTAHNVELELYGIGEEESLLEQKTISSIIGKQGWENDIDISTYNYSKYRLAVKCEDQERYYSNNEYIVEENNETIPLKIIYNEYSIDDRLTVRSILKNNSETDKKLLVKISICNDKMEVIEEQEREMMIEAKGSSEIKKRFEKREDGMIIIQVYDEQGKKEEVGGDYCITIEK